MRVLVHADLPLLCAHTVDREKLTPLAVLVGVMYPYAAQSCCSKPATNTVHQYATQTRYMRWFQLITLY